MNNEKLYEQLAAIEHGLWADWQRYMHSKFTKMELPNDDGNYDMIIPADLFLRWERQINTHYNELSEQEKEIDRKQVDRYWNIIKDRLFNKIYNKKKKPIKEFGDEDYTNGWNQALSELKQEIEEL